MASDDIALLAEALSKTHVGNGELSYKGRGLKLDTAESVKELVGEIEEYQGLRALRLEGNTLGVEAARAIAKALESKDQLQSCHWSDMFTGRLRSEIPNALRSLGSALMTAGARLTELDLSDNAFGPDGVKSIETLLKSSACHSLREGALAMAQALRHLRSVQVINFGDCLVRSEGAIAISAVLREGLPILKELNLSFGEITEAAALVVAQAVQDKPHMEKLDLNGNCLGEEGCEALKETMENMDLADLLGSLSDDEGEPDEDDEEEEEEEETDEEDGEEIKENGVTEGVSPVNHQPACHPEVVSFLSFPTAEGLLQLGKNSVHLFYNCQASCWVSVFEWNTNVSVFACHTDALLKKAFSGSSLQTYSFLSTLLVMLGLLKGEGKVKKVQVLPGHLLVLEHTVQQDYFPQDHASLLDTFVARHGKALKSCSSARDSLKSTLERRISPEC
uniref:Ran-GTPase activating protein 1 C-terminal domain-containing protein n=1 Tax=Esox lucius TaxID=8010 RepID=A0AAY5L9H0_ESOLU